MVLHRHSILLTVLAAVALILAPALVESGWLGSGEAHAKGKRAKKKSASKKRSSKRKSSKRKSARVRKRSRRGKRRGKKSRGHAVGASKLRAEVLTKPSGNLWIYTENQKEELRVNIYDKSGDFNDAALAKLDFEFRCRRTNEERAFDPKLYEMLSRIQDHFKGKRIHLVSGFRFQKNEGSRHYHASAMDIRIPGVSIGQIREYAASLDRGGMGIGIYPRSGFVHVDFRAPGEPSYRWVDYSGKGKGRGRGKSRSRRFKRRNPNT